MPLRLRQCLGLAVLTLSLSLLSGGCAGNRVNPSTDLLPVTCLDKPDPGDCAGRRLGYYYDYSDNRCKPFVHGNCPRKVPFRDKAECLTVCGADP